MVRTFSVATHKLSFPNKKQTAAFFIRTLKIWFWTLVGILITAFVCWLIDEYNPLDWRTAYGKSSFPYKQDTSQLKPFEPMSYSVKIDFHVHTLVSDGSLSSIQTAQWLNASGYNVAFISDHQTTQGYYKMLDAIKDKPDLKNNLLIFPALEWTSCRIHMNLLNIKKDFPLCGVDSLNNTITSPCPWPSDDLLKWVVIF